MSVTNNTPQRYINITSAVLAATVGLTTIKQIRYSIKTKKIQSQGDADTAMTFMAKGSQEVTGTVTLEDPVQAAAMIAAASGTFVFTGLNPMTGRVLTVTITNCLFFDTDGDEKHDDVAGVSVTFAGYFTTGVLASVASA